MPAVDCRPSGRGDGSLRRGELSPARHGVPFARDHAGPFCAHGGEPREGEVYESGLYVDPEAAHLQGWRDIQEHDRLKRWRKDHPLTMAMAGDFTSLEDKLGI